MADGLGAAIIRPPVRQRKWKEMVPAVCDVGTIAPVPRYCATELSTRITAHLEAVCRTVSGVARGSLEVCEKVEMPRHPILLDR